MHEHGGEKCQKIANGVGQESAGDKGPPHDKRVTTAQLYEEKQYIQGDQSIGDQWDRSTRAIIITDWEHGISLLLLLKAYLLQVLRISTNE
jgi:hypothetical protein